MCNFWPAIILALFALKAGTDGCTELAIGLLVSALLLSLMGALVYEP